MLWHGSKEIFSRFSLADAGRLTGASNGALGIWCAFDGQENFAARFAGENGALYGIQEPAGTVYAMPLKELLSLHEEAKDLEEIDLEVALYDRFRRDLLAAGHGRIDIVEKDGTHSMCVVLDPEAIIIEKREIQIIPHDRLPKVAGLDTGNLISEEAFSALHSENRHRILDAFNRHISGMGTEERTADGRRNFSARVGELNQRREPFVEAMRRLTGIHEEIRENSLAERRQTPAGIAAPQESEEPAF